MRHRSPFKWMIFGSAVGATTMYLFDPGRGVRRRHGLVDRARKAVDDIEGLAGKARRDLENRLHGVSARLHGSPRSHRTRTALDRSTPERRLIEGGVGVALAGYGLVRGGLRGLLATAGGFGLIARAAIEQPHGFVRVQKTITIEAPLDQVYALFSRFENFPRFMEHVLEVTTDGDRSHWCVRGPAGLQLSWDAEVTDRIPNRKLVWRSLARSAVAHHGEIHFEPQGERATRVNIHLAYRPPAGAVGHALAAVLHGDPKHLLDADLMRLQTLLEQGHATIHGADVRREEL